MRDLCFIEVASFVEVEIARGIGFEAQTKFDAGSFERRSLKVYLEYARDR